MPRRRDEKARVLGPTWLEARGDYRVRTVDPQANGGRGGHTDRHFVDEQEAQEWRDVVHERLQRLTGVTVAEAISMYGAHLVESGRQMKSSVDLLTYKLGLLFKSVADSQISRVTATKAQQLYTEFRIGKSVDYHRNTLGNARGFLDWCVKGRLTTENAMKGVEGVGRRSRGKKQLTGDEARRFYKTGLALAHQGDDGALGSVMLLLMGLRQSEVFKRRVRDLDLDGTVLRIEDAKTERGNRIAPVPEVLRQLLRDVAEDRKPTDVLFARPDDQEHTKAWLHAAVKRVCIKAGVPVVCPHGLRGTHATLGLQAGVGTRAVADALGHVSDETTRRHYIEPGAFEAARQAQAVDVISRGESRGQLN